MNLLQLREVQQTRKRYMCSQCWNACSGISSTMLLRSSTRSNRLDFNTICEECSARVRALEEEKKKQAEEKRLARNAKARERRKALRQAMAKAKRG